MANAGDLITTGQTTSYNIARSLIKKIAEQALSGANEALTTNFERALGFINEDAVQRNQAFLEPFRAGGEAALNRALAFQGIGPEALTPDQIQQQFLSTPGTQFQLEQGKRAVESSASARGLLGSGRLLKELQKQGQGVASQFFSQRQDELARLAGLGANAAAQSASLGQQQGSERASLLATLGQQQAGAQFQAANLRTSALQNDRISTQQVGDDFGRFLTLATKGSFRPI